MSSPTRTAINFRDLMNQRARKPIRSPLVKKDRDRPVVQQPAPAAQRMPLTSLIPNRGPAAGRPPPGREAPAVKDGPSFGAWLTAVGAAGLQNPRNAQEFKRYVNEMYLSKLKGALSQMSQQIQSDIQDPQMARLVMRAIVDTVAGGVGAIAKGEVPDPAQRAASVRTAGNPVRTLALDVIAPLKGLSTLVDDGVFTRQGGELEQNFKIPGMVNGVLAAAEKLQGMLVDGEPTTASVDDAVEDLMHLGSSFVSSKNVRSALNYIRNAVKNGLDAKQAARDFKSKYPTAFADIMDYIGSYPSSETELRALQLVASHQQENDMKIQETIRELLAAGYKAEAVEVAARLMPTLLTAGRKVKVPERDVEYTISCEPEDTSIEGNAMASGDDAADKAAEDEIREQLDSGNEWAWCTVKVTARWKSWTGVDTLGCCSYASEADFKTGGYFEDMKKAALDNLKANVQHHADEVEALEREEEATEASTKSAKLTPQQMGIIEDLLKGMDQSDPAYKALSEYAKGLKTQGPQKGQSVGIQSLAAARKSRIAQRTASEIPGLAKDEADLAKCIKDIATLEGGGKVDNLTLENAKKDKRALEQCIQNKKKLGAAQRTAKGLGIQEGTIQTHLDVMKQLAEKGDIQGLAKRLKELEADVGRASKGASTEPVSTLAQKRKARLAASKNKTAVLGADDVFEITGDYYELDRGGDVDMEQDWDRRMTDKPIRASYRGDVTIGGERHMLLTASDHTRLAVLPQNAKHV